MDETLYRVVGVLAAGLRDRGAAITVPLVIIPKQRLSHQQRVVVTGRLRTGISVLEAQSDVDMALARISRNDLNLAVVPINIASLNSDRKLTIWLLLGLVAFLLLMESVGVLSLFRLRSEAGLKRNLKPSGGFWP